MNTYTLYKYHSIIIIIEKLYGIEFEQTNLIQNVQPTTIFRKYFGANLYTYKSWLDGKKKSQRLKTVAKSREQAQHNLMPNFVTY